jgi:hypothetical protein
MLVASPSKAEFIDEFPPEVWTLVLENLDSPTDFQNTLLYSKYFQSFEQTRSVWPSLAHKLGAEVFPGQSFKNAVISHLFMVKARISFVQGAHNLVNLNLDKAEALGNRSATVKKLLLRLSGKSGLTPDREGVTQSILELIRARNPIALDTLQQSVDMTWRWHFESEDFKEAHDWIESETQKNNLTAIRLRFLAKILGKFGYDLDSAEAEKDLDYLVEQNDFYGMVMKSILVVSRSLPPVGGISKEALAWMDSLAGQKGRENIVPVKIYWSLSNPSFGVTEDVFDQAVSANQDAMDEIHLYFQLIPTDFTASTVITPELEVALRAKAADFLKKTKGKWIFGYELID